MESINKIIVIENQIEIEGQPPFVWNIFRDLENWPVWNSICDEAIWLDGPSWVQGSKFKTSIAIGNKLVDQEVKLLNSDIPWIIEWVSVNSEFEEKRKFELDWRGKITIVLDTITLEFKSYPVNTEELAVKYTEMSDRWLSDLKEEVKKNGDKLWNLSAAERPRK
jgi:uncharacterized membrane protein